MAVLTAETAQAIDALQRARKTETGWPELTPETAEAAKTLSAAGIDHKDVCRRLFSSHAFSSEPQKAKPGRRVSFMAEWVAGRSWRWTAISYDWGFDVFLGPVLLRFVRL